MTVTRDTVLEALKRLSLPGGGDLVSRDMVRALTIEDEAGGAAVRFVVEAPDPEAARKLEPISDAAEELVRRLPGVARASAILTAHGGTASQGAGAQEKAPPQLKIGGHPTPQQGGPQKVPGIDRIIAIASGKGGVGKSTVASNLAVALARQGRRVGLLDADIYGPSQPRMMGITTRPDAPDGKTIQPPSAHGVTMMSLGLLLKEDQAVIWRGPMLMGALQQLLTQVNWGRLDALLVDLPPGTGDVQLTLGQKAQVTGAIVVSTPQDIALIDARKAINMFQTLKVPVLGLVENMSSYVCPNCGHEEHIFGHGGVGAEAKKLGVPLLGEIPLSLDVRVAGDSGTPIAAGDGPIAAAYARIAERLIAGGMG
jgi:ATP-binding protein involved in chromosome partitioning